MRSAFVKGFEVARAVEANRLRTLAFDLNDEVI